MTDFMIPNYSIYSLTGCSTDMLMTQLNASLLYMYKMQKLTGQILNNSLFQNNCQNFFNNNLSIFNYQNMFKNMYDNKNQFPQFNMNALQKLTLKSTTGKAVLLSKNERIEILKKYLKNVEGGFANVKGDKGGATKHGVTHFTYDSYRKRKGLPKQSVELMTDNEFTEIIEHFWEDGGASKVSDPILAFYVFSADWGSGIGRGKKLLAQCGSNPTPEKFEEVRRAYYNRIAVDTNAKFKKGWQNRVTKDHDFAYKNFVK